MKEKLFNMLGTAGYVVYFLFSIFITALPLLMLDIPLWLHLVFFFIMQIIPATSVIFWIWGLVGAIQGPQDTFAIIFYVVFVIMFIPFIISTVSDIVNKFKRG